MRHAPIRRLPLAAALLALLHAAAAPAATGGPDAYGYSWADSFEPGVVFAWEDVSASGTDITVVADDANTGFRALSFAFPYRGRTYAAVAACTNGWISLVDSGSDAYENRPLPDGGPPAGAIAPFWDDFKMDDGGKILFQDFGDHAVVSWVDVPYFSDVTKHATFQAILFADGRIRSQILATDGPLDSATIGIESVDGGDGLTAWFDAPIPPPPYAVQFTPPVPIPDMLDCAAAPTLACGDDLTLDLATGVAAQDAYRCVRDVLSGREHAWRVQFDDPTTVRILFEALTGDPRLVIVPDCDPNGCTVPATNVLTLDDSTGGFWLIVDSPAGGEGTYRLEVECLPVPTDLDCGVAVPVACGDAVTGDLAAGAAVQDSYWCSLADYSGREQVYVVDFPSQVATVTFTLTALGGDPDLVVLQPCDANACHGAPGDSLTIADAIGTYLVVVDAVPGNEGPYELAISGGAAPARDVGPALRATASGQDGTSLSWPSAPLPLPADRYAVLRADDDPTGPWDLLATTRSRAFTDAAAPARFPRHLWYYLILAIDPCGNLSAD